MHTHAGRLTGLTGCTQAATRIHTHNYYTRTHTHTHTHVYTRRASDRLDWMYAGSLASKEDATKKQDEALLGQRPAQLPDTVEPGGKVCVCCFFLVVWVFFHALHSYLTQ